MPRRKERVIPLDIGCMSDSPEFEPKLLMSDRAAFLVIGDASGRAIVEFKGCVLVRFGYPGAMALKGHPLHAKGLGKYGVYEVFESAWLNQIKNQHATAKTDEPLPAGLRHFAFAFRDSTL